MLGLVYKTQKYVIYLFTYKSTQAQKFAVDPVQHGFQEIPLPRIFRVKKLE